MALKDLMLQKELKNKRAALEELQEKAKELETREAELEETLEEVQTEEEKATFEEAVDEFEKDKEENAEKAAALESEIEELEKELDERKSKAEEAARKTEKVIEPEERKEEKTTMIKRTFETMTMEERSALVARDDVKAFLQEVRTRMQSRAITNGAVAIPEVLVGIMYAKAEETSKLLKHVRAERVPGIARIIVDGGFPEAVWTEQCANLNELTIGLYDIEVDGYKVGGYIKVCNALLEDSDIDLAAYITDKLGRAIGYSLDKAIAFGTGTKMPLGFATRLLQTSKPAGWRETSPWSDYHTSNVTKISTANSAADKIFQNILAATANMNGKFADGKFWIMNQKTLVALQAAAMSTTAAGAIVTGVTNQMPVIGGVIEVLDFVPDNMIFGGYDGCYFLAERSGATIDYSEHAFWTEDVTCFKGVARYDGKPAIADAFVAIGINNTDVSLSGINFAADTANATTSA